MREGFARESSDDLIEQAQGSDKMKEYYTPAPKPHESEPKPATLADIERVLKGRQEAQSKIDLIISNLGEGNLKQSTLEIKTSLEKDIATLEEKRRQLQSDNTES